LHTTKKFWYRDFFSLLPCSNREVRPQNHLESFLCSQRFALIRIDGKTQQVARQPLCDQFQTDPTCRVALLSLTAAGVGLTLHAATSVVFAELFWNPGQLLQVN
jgi:SWI/SNF-related matrix-associated actin-dependent regulator 1 of chromatin subfamily A